MNATNPEAEAEIRPVRRPMFKWNALIFLCGVLTGAGLAAIGIQSIMSYHHRNPERAYVRMVEHAVSELQLTPEQHKRIVDVAREKEAELSSLFSRDFRTRVDAHFDSLRDAVVAVLDKRQAEVFLKRFEEMRTRSIPPFPPPTKEH